jgi:hypothetical protein
LFDHGLLLLEEFRVDRKAVDEAMAVDGHADRPASVGDFEPFGRRAAAGPRRCHAASSGPASGVCLRLP